MVSHPRTHREGFLGSGTKVKPLADSRYFPAGEGKLIMMVFSHARINGNKSHYIRTYSPLDKNKTVLDPAIIKFHISLVFVSKWFYLHSSRKSQILSYSFIYSCFERGCRKKGQKCMRQSRKVIWVYPMTGAITYLMGSCRWSMNFNE